jgi:hypothetical protein
MLKFKWSPGRHLLLILTLLLANASYAQQDKGFIWEVQGGTNTLYLLGSLHFANTDFYPVRQEIQQAFQRSDNLVVEIDVDRLAPEQVQRLITSKGTYPYGESIKNHIRETTYQGILQYLQSRNLPTAAFDNYKPAMLMMALTSLELERMGLSSDFGLDLYFTRQARGKKRIHELETLEDQLDMLLNIKDGDQLLMQTLNEFKDYQSLTDSLLQAWETGDPALLKRLIIDQPLKDFPESAAVFDKLITRRNYQMTSKIIGYLKTGGSYFVVAGAGHMIGEEGIIAQLEQAGYRVKQL